MRNFVFFSFILLFPKLAISQIVLNTDDDTPVECIEILQGSALDFEVVKCDEEIIMFDANFIPDDSFTPVGTIFSHTFLTPGEYSIYCGYRPPGTEVAILAACIVVLPVEPVPTTSEWGVIILCLIFLNVSIISIKSLDIIPMRNAEP